MRDFNREFLDLGNCLGNHAVAFASFFRCVDRSVRSLLCVACNFLNGRRHFVHRSGDLIGFALLAVDAGAGLLGDG